MSTKTRVTIIGAKGRMGEALVRLAKQDPRLELAAAVDKGDDLAAAIAGCDAVIEFAHHGVTPDVAKLAAEKLGEDYDQEVVEMHHRRKLDAPSGTARRLGEILAKAAGGTYDELLQHGRHGEVGARPKRTIGMHALRGGDVVGDHTVIYAGDGERIELSHKASSRDTFAAGALRAAQWVRGQKAGLYTMQDVLGLN